MKQALLIALCFLASTANAATLYVVDVQRVIEHSIAGKSAKENLEVDIKKTESKVAIKRAELERLKADLQKQAAVLSNDARDQKAMVIRDKSRDLEKLIADERDELKRKSDSAMESVVKKLDGVIAKISQELGYKVVLQKDPRLVLYVAPEFDLTDEVIQSLDSQKLK